MKKKDIIILILLIAFFILAGCFFFWVNSEGSKCLAEPFKYTFKFITPQPDYCYCNAGDSVISFNDTSLTTSPKLSFS